MRKSVSFLLLVGLHVHAAAQKIQYDISFPNVAHHEAVVAVTASGIPKTAAVFRMSRSSPGRYATHEFGKNVYDVKAYDKSGAQITINRIDGDVYQVPKQDGYVKVTYTLYGNYADGTYAGIDLQNIHLNMPATFMWMKGMDTAPIEIKFNVPAGNAGKAWMGNTRFTETPKGLQVSTNTIKYSPIYKAGIDVDDIIEKADGKETLKEEALNTLIDTHKPGDVLEIVFNHRGTSKTTSLTLAENPAYTITTFENAGMTVTPEMKKLREDWLGSKQ